jgi:hypothetical protein
MTSSVHAEGVSRRKNLHGRSSRLMNEGQLAVVEGISWELLLEIDEDGAGLLGTVFAEGGDGEHHASEGCKVVALGGGEMKESDAFVAASGGSGEVEKPAEGSPLEAKHIVFNTAGEVGVVEGGVGRKGSFGPGAGIFAVVEGGEVAFVDHERVIGAHAGDEGFDVEGTGVVGIALQGGVCEVASLVEAVLKGLADCGVRGETGAAIELVLICEELDVYDMETFELIEKKGGGIGDGTHGVLGVGSDPLLKLEVGIGELEVVHVPVALVEGGAGEGSGRREHRDRNEQEKGEQR